MESLAERQCIPCRGDARAASAWSNGDTGLDRCRYKGYLGMNRWVGLGVIADNVVNIGRAMEKQTAP
jgi:hypothetical protein